MAMTRHATCRLERMAEGAIEAGRRRTTSSLRRMRRFTPLALGWAIVLGGIGLVQLFAWASSAQRIVEAAPPIPSDEGDICGADCFVLAGAEADDEGERRPAARGARGPPPRAKTSEGTPRGATLSDGASPPVERRLSAGGKGEPFPNLFDSYSHWSH